MKDISRLARPGRRSAEGDVRRGIDLIDLVRLAHYDLADPDGPDALRAAERRATRIVAYDALAVPALLQTPEYARFLGNDPDRAEVLHRHLPPVCEFFLHETALHAWAGDQEVLDDQLAALARRDDVRLVPFTAGCRPELRHSFTLLAFAVGGPAVHAEALSEQVDVIARFQVAVEVLRRCALDVDESRRVFASPCEAAG